LERRPEFSQTYATLIRLRKQHSALRSGDLKWLSNDEESRVVSFSRSDASEEIVAVVNLSNRPCKVKVAVGPEEGFVELVNGAKASPAAIDLEAFGWRWYRRPIR